MSNKELKLKGRVQNKHKTEAEWYLDVYKAAGSTELRDDPFIPLNGELIIYDPDSVYTERRFKIGDGVTNVVTLSFYQGNPAELLTESKGVVGAINEIDDRMDALVGDYSKGLSYTLNNQTSYTVTGIGTCTDTKIVIPSKYQGLPVTSIGETAFYNCTSLTSVTIGDSVTSIGEGAFYNCTSLKSITIPDSVTSIGRSAFYNCSSLTSINIPNSVTSIDREVFRGCSSLTSVTIPDSITSIEYRAFYECTSLTSIVIPDSVTSIGGGAFYDCRSLTSIGIPNTVTSIEYGGFYPNTIHLYCEHENQPDGWDPNWNVSGCPVIWGFAGDFIAVNNKYQSKIDNSLETNSKEIVGAINELNSKTVDKIMDISFTSGTISSIANEGDGIYWEYKETEIQVGDDLHYVDNVSNKVPIISGENINFEVDEDNQVVKISATDGIDKLVAIDPDRIEYIGKDSKGINWNEYLLFRDEEDGVLAEVLVLNKAPIVAGENVNFEVDEENQVVKVNASDSIDKMERIDTWYYGTEAVSDDGDGISWEDGFAFLSDEVAIKEGTISQKIPLVAGENVTFSYDEYNNAIAINATGGSSSNASLIGTWTVIDEPEIPTTDLPLSFTSNGKTYTQISWGITGSSTWGIYNLRYQTEDRVYDDIAYTNNPSGNYGIAHGWSNDAYKTITVTEEPTDARAIAWLGTNTNAPKVIVYQEKIDTSLATTDKTIVGAINELHNEIGDISAVLDALITQTETIIGGTES